MTRTHHRHAAPFIAALLLAATLAAWPTAAGAVPIIVPHGYTTMVRGTPKCESITKGPDGNVWITCGWSDTIGRITPAGVMTLFPVGTAYFPRGIVAAPDGNLWFTSFGNDRIGRITPTGTVTTYAHATISSPIGIALGPDGALWFTNSGIPSIGRITTAGAVTAFVDAKVGLPDQITAGPDGNLWFSEPSANSIGRITPGGVVTSYTTAAVKSPRGITKGPDGNLWFANSGDDSIGRITPAGVITIVDVTGVDFTARITTGPDGKLWYTGSESDSVGWYDPDTATFGSVSGPLADAALGITPGPDGQLWITTAKSIAHVSIAGLLTTVAAGKVLDPQDITTGPDGNLWYTNTGSIGRVTPRGSATTFTKDGLKRPSHLTAGPDGNLWFTDYEANTVGRITPAGAIELHTDAKIARPTEITTGPDGNLWFVNSDSAMPSIGRITPAGAVKTYTHSSITYPIGIASGPGRSVWFTNDGPDAESNVVGRLSTQTGIITPFLAGPGVAAPSGIVAGPDGNLWFTNNDVYPLGQHKPSIARMTPQGVVTNFPDAALSAPQEIIVGADGDIWFNNANGIGRIARNGAITVYTNPQNDVIMSLTPGPDGNGWIATSSSTIGRIRIAPQQFVDVPVGAPFYADINWLVNQGITTGYDDDTFKPTAPVTRQAMAAFLYRYKGSPLGDSPPCPSGPFSDVPKGAPFCGEITWLVNNDIGQGYPDGTFKPTVAITRQAMAAFLYRTAVGGDPPACLATPFTDVPKANAFCGHITWLVAHDIANGYPDGTFKPGAAVSRQAMAAFLHRVYNYQHP